MAHRRWSRHAFVGLCALAVVLAVAINTLAGSITKDKLAGDVASVLKCAMQTEDRVYAVGGFPHDLPFLARLRRPMVVVQDWGAARQSNKDNWRRELFESVDFDAGAARLLQTPDALAAASLVPGHWLVTPLDYRGEGLSGWSELWRGTGWVVYRAVPSDGPSHTGALPGGLEHCLEPGAKMRSR